MHIDLNTKIMRYNSVCLPKIGKMQNFNGIRVFINLSEHVKQSIEFQ